MFLAGGDACAPGHIISEKSEKSMLTLRFFCGYNFSDIVGSLFILQILVELNHSDNAIFPYL